MFSNSGRVIKAFAWILFVVSLIGLLFAAVPLLENDRTAVTGLVVLLVGGFFSWMFSIMMYAVGDTQENSETLLYRITEIEMSLKNVDRKIETSEKPTTSATVHPKTQPTESSATGSTSAGKARMLPTDQPDMVTCSLCGQLQRNNRTKCFRCAVDFEI